MQGRDLLASFADTISQISFAHWVAMSNNWATIVIEFLESLDTRTAIGFKKSALDNLM